MHKLFNLFIFFAFVLTSQVTGETLTLHVKQLRSLKGNLMVYLWGSPDSYLMKSKADYQLIVDLENAENGAKNGLVQIKITDLKPGAYAVMLYHDENRTYNFERNFVGIPMEGFAFGNNARPNLGAPKFQEASISLIGAEVDHQINVLY